MDKRGEEVDDKWENFIHMTFLIDPLIISLSKYASSVYLPLDAVKVGLILFLPQFFLVPI